MTQIARIMSHRLDDGTIGPATILIHFLFAERLALRAVPDIE